MDVHLSRCIFISSIMISGFVLENGGAFAKDMVGNAVAETEVTFNTTEETSLATTAAPLMITAANKTLTTSIVSSQPTASSTTVTTLSPSTSTTVITSLTPKTITSPSPTKTTATTMTNPTTTSTLATTPVTTKMTIPTTTQTTTPTPTKPTTTKLTTTPTTTTEAPLTCSTNTPTCPAGWFRAERDVCVLVETAPTKMNTSLEALQACSTYGKRAFQLNSTTRTVHTMSCIKGVLASSRIPAILLADARVLLLNSAQEVDVWRYMNYYSYRSYLYFVCLIRSDVELAKIAKFSLTVTSVTEGTISTQDLLQTNGTLLVPIRRHNRVSFTCQSSSDPLPQVWLERENYSRPQFSNPSSYTLLLQNVSCTDSTTLTCIARNYYGWMKMWKRIQFIHARSVEFLDFGVFQGNLQIKGAIPLNADVSLLCSINACPRPSLLSIEDSQRLPIFSVPDSLSVQYEVRLVHCQDMGPYFCAARTQDGGVVEVRTELVVNGRCPVQPCRGESTTRHIRAALGETVNISLCILTYPTPSVFYDSDNPRLSVNLTKTAGSQLVYMAHLTLSNIQHSDYKTHSLVFNNVHGAVVFNVSLGPEGPPPCPTGLTVTDTGLDYVSLSWQPAEYEGLLLAFHVFYSGNSRTWRRWEVAEEEGSEVTVSGLKKDTGYFFRVVASDEFFSLVNQSLCPETVVAKTASDRTTRSSAPSSASSGVHESQPRYPTSPPRDRTVTHNPADVHQHSPAHSNGAPASASSPHSNGAPASASSPHSNGASASASFPLPINTGNTHTPVKAFSGEPGSTRKTPNTASSEEPGSTPRTHSKTSSLSPGSTPTMAPEHMPAELTHSPDSNSHQPEQSQAVSLNPLHISLPIVSLNVAVLLMCAFLLYIKRGRLLPKQKNTSAWKNYDKLSADYLKYERESLQELETNSTAHLMSAVVTQDVIEM